MFVGPNTKILKRFRQDQTSFKYNLVPGPFSDTPQQIYRFLTAIKAQVELINDNRDKVFSLVFLNNSKKDYVPMVGDAAFNTQAQMLIFGDNNPLIKEDMV